MSIYRTILIKRSGVTSVLQPTFLVNPNGIIEFATPSAERGYSIWDAMQEKIPRGDE